jgi:transposase-like protein
MTDVTEDRDPAGTELSAADEQLLRELTERARAGGLKLTGEGGLLGRLTKMVVEGALEGEMDDHLGYAKHDLEGRNGGNSRNGHRAKTVLTEAGPVEISVPRDRESSFEPKIVAKRQRRLNGVEEIVISLSARGLTHGEIAAHLAEVYGAEVSKQTITAITDRVMEGLADWQSRPLDPVYAVLFIDAINVKIREGQVANRPIYLALGVTVDGERDVLGLWAGEHGDGEGAKYWLRVLAEIKNRGTRDVCLLVCDGLKGLPDAVGAVWEKTIVQTCIVHLLRNSFRYASKRDWAQVAKDLKPVYTAASEAEALDRFAEFSGKWEKRYPAIIRLWENAWAEFVPFLAFDQEIRTVICTTNAIESINARLRRAVNARGHFLSVTWNPICRAISSGTVSPVAEERFWVPSCSRRSGPCWAATMPRPDGCGSGPIWGGHPGRSTRMPVAWPSIWRSASGKASTRWWRTGRMSRCSFASSPAGRAVMVPTWCRSSPGPGCPTPRFSSGWSRSGCSMTISLRRACASPTRSGAGNSRRAAASEARSGG